jgi:hypothetical protein
VPRIRTVPRVRTVPRIRTPLRIRILLRIRMSWHGRHRVIGRALPFLYMIVLFGSLKIYSARLKMIPAAG